MFALTKAPFGWVFACEATTMSPGQPRATARLASAPGQEPGRYYEEHSRAHARKRNPGLPWRGDARGRFAPPRSAGAPGARGRARRRRDAAPAGGGETAGAAARRAAPRDGAGRRQEPAARLRGRARPAQPPPDARPLAGSPARLAAPRPAVARARLADARGAALEWPRSGTDPAGAVAARAGHPGRPARPRRDGRGAPAGRPEPRARRRAPRP